MGGCTEDKLSTKTLEGSVLYFLSLKTPGQKNRGLPGTQIYQSTKVSGSLKLHIGDSGGKLKTLVQFQFKINR